MQLDDWVLCRIYNKSKHDTSSSSTPEPMLTAAEQEQDHHHHNHNQLFKQSNFPASTSSAMNNYHVPPPHTTTLASNKSLSFSNLLDAMDYSMLSSFLSDQTQSNPSAPATVHGASGNGMEHQLTVPSVAHVEHVRQKRHLSEVMNEEAIHPSKKYQLPYCTFQETGHDQYENSNNPQWNFLHKQPLLSQQLLLGPHLRFQ